ncbi:hypothetical protein ZOSMA_36G00180 [Zostera marina]|uniref:Uncharacterized protein n=1 Tax=Zostera marina TaxID=29655 RepID=A0A0K9P5W0_ZOSMR|nr:hypothetical protein ZOSMA_36G00180 [Zostera marina]
MWIVKYNLSSDAYELIYLFNVCNILYSYSCSGKFSWEHVLKHIALRKKYVTLYASLLNSDSGQLVIDNKEIDNLDRELDIEVIIQWRYSL